MRTLGSRYFTAALLVALSALAIVVLWVELTAALGWARCTDEMAHSLILCDAGPGGWVLPATALLAVAFAFAAGISVERARSRPRASDDIRER